ncbi:MAG: diacylglycerol kinase family protein [bacterium]|nr:diacylglycerol kinase family protein [bacterium]
MKKFFQGFIFAWRGIITSLKSERNLRFHFFVAISVTIAGFIFDISRIDWMMQITAIGLVITTELMNTAIEYLINLVSPEKNDIAGKVKDIAAGAVLISSFVALVLGLIIYLPIIFNFS